MARGIRGITVKIGGDTTELGRSLSSASKQSSSLQKELRGVNSLLKFDTSNVTLLKQKEELLKKAIEETETRQRNLNEVLQKVNTGEIEMTEEEYRNLQREIAATENNLNSLHTQQREFGSVGAQQIAAVGTEFQELGGKIEDVGTKLLPVTAGLTALGIGAVKTAADFDESMSNVSAISGATGDDLEALRSKAREMGSQTKFSAKESADAMSYMAMAGWKTQDMIGGIEGVMNLAAASGSDLATTSDILTDGLTAFGLTAQESGRMADVMAAASSNANTNVNLLGESYKYCASTAGAMGYSVEDITESLGLMANAGVKGSQAGTSLKTAMINLAKPTTAMQTAMDKYGISLTDNEGNMKSWNTMVNELRTNLGGLSEAEKTSAAATLFGKEATAGMLSLINAAPEDIEKLNGAISNSEGTAKGMADTMNNNLNGQITILKSQIQELSIAFGEILMPTIRDVTSKVQGFIDKLNKLSPAQKEQIAKIALVVAAIGPLLVVIGKLIKSIGTVMTWAPKIVSTCKSIGLAITGVSSPVLAVVAAIAVLVGAFVYLWNTNEEFREAVTEIWNQLTTAFNDFSDGIVERLNDLGFNFEDIGDVLFAIWDTFCNTIAPLVIGQFQFIADTVSFVFNTILSVLDIFIGLFTGDWDQFCDGIKNLFKGLWDFATSIINNAIKTMLSLIDTFLGWFGTSISDIYDFIASIFSTAWEFIKGIFTTAYDFIKGIIDTVVGVFKVAYDLISGFASACWEFIKGVFSAVFGWFDEYVIQPVISIFATCWDAISGLASGCWEGIKSVFSAISGWINDYVIQPVTSFFSTMWEGLTSGASSAWEGIKSVFNAVTGFFSEVFGKAWNAVKDIFCTGGKVFMGIVDGIADAFKGIVNTLIDGINTIVAVPFNAINGMLNAIHDVKIPIIDVKPFSGLWSRDPVGIPKIPKLAQGGILRRGQVGLLEGDGSEAVVPLEKNTEWTRRVAQQIGEYQNNDNGALLEKMDKIYNKLDKLKQSIVLDTGVLVGETINRIDSELGNVNNRTVRGW